MGACFWGKQAKRRDFLALRPESNPINPHRKHNAQSHYFTPYGNNSLKAQNNMPEFGLDTLICKNPR